MSVVAPSRRHAPRRNRAAVTIAALLGGLFLASGLAFLLSPMRVKGVRFLGMRNVTSAELMRLADIQPGMLVGGSEVRQLERDLARYPAFESVSVRRRLDGILIVRVNEREPVAWSAAAGCAVTADGHLLRFMAQRDPDWVCLQNLAVAGGVVTEPGIIAEAAAGWRIVRHFFADAEGKWRRLGGNPPAWEWSFGGKRILLSSPVMEEEIQRLRRFLDRYPGEWRRSAVLDLRFAERVVMRR